MTPREQLSDVDRKGGRKWLGPASGYGSMAWACPVEGEGDCGWGLPADRESERQGAGVWLGAYSLGDTGACQGGKRRESVCSCVCVYEWVSWGEFWNARRCDKGIGVTLRGAEVPFD